MITPGYSLTASERVLPSMALDFRTGVLDSRVTITRALNTATAVNSIGYVAVVNADLPRFDYNPVTLACRGLLIESARTNVLTYSEQFDDVAWVKTNATVTANATAAPSNETTADKLIATVVSGVHRVASTAGGNAVNGTSYTLSVYAKASEYGFLRLVDTTYMAAGPMFDLTNGTVSSTGGFTATISAAANGFYRCTATFTATGTATLESQILVYSSSSTADYTGDGTSGIFIWGAQLEAGAFPTSYIPTTTTSVARNADTVAMTGSNFSSWFNATEGTLAVTASLFNTGSTAINPFADLITNAQNSMSFGKRVAGGGVNNFQMFVNNGNVTQAFIQATSVLTANNTYYTGVGAYKLNSFQAACAGTAGTPDTSGTVPTVNQLQIGSSSGVGGFLNGHMALVRYWPQRLINAEVQAFSK